MIRLAKTTDLPKLLEIYDYAKKFMAAAGNPTQWNGAYPDMATLENDIQNDWLFVIENEGATCGVFALIYGVEACYNDLHGGSWGSDTPYATVHRIAGDGTKSGLFAECVDFALERFDHLRVDTHPDNIPMQKAIAKAGFVKRGTVYVEDGSPRYAYDYIK